MEIEIDGAGVAKIVLLQVFLDNREIQRRAFTIKEKISIGRDAYADVCLEDPSVSRLHLEIHREGGELVLHDRSANGTLVNGRRESKRILRHRDVLTIGSFDVILEVHADSRLSLYDEARAEGLTMDEGQTISCAS